MVVLCGIITPSSYLLALARFTHRFHSLGDKMAALIPGVSPSKQEE